MQRGKNLLPKLWLAAIGAGFAVCSYFFLNNLGEIRSLFADPNDGSSPEVVLDRPHLLLIYPEEESLFTEDLLRGFAERAAELNLLVEFRAFQRNAPVQSAAYYLQIGILSGADAILLYAPSPNSQTLAEIESAWAQEIPVITLVSDLPESRRAAFVGQNAYQLGVLGGTLVRQANTRGSVGIVLDQSPEASMNQHNRLLLDGLRANLLGAAELTQIFYSDGSPFSGRKIGEQALNSEVDVLLTVPARDTPGIVQHLVENARVGELTLLGFDLTGDLEEYLEKGLVHASVNRLPWHIGYRAVGTAMAILAGEPFPRADDPGTLIQLADELRPRAGSAATSDANTDAGERTGTGSGAEDQAGTESEARR